MVQDYKTDTEIKADRNYQLDFLKLFFSLCVFVFHSRILSNKGHIVRLITNKWGFMSVHFFFLVSGLLMIESYMKKDRTPPEKCGKEAGKYVLRKFVGISVPYYAAFVISFISRIIIETYNDRDIIVSLRETFIKSIPEMFLLQNSGISPIELNTAAWYISAMLICMLFQNYLLRKKTDFFIYVFSPLIGILLLGYFYSSGEPLYPFKNLTGYINSGLLRGFCGISFGAVSWIIADFLQKRVTTKKQQITVTVTELVLSLIFIIVWFNRSSNAQFFYPVLLIMPVIIGIIFSETSLVKCLFRSRMFKKCGTFSLVIYLNHFAPYRLVQKLDFFDKYAYKEKFGFMVLFTAISCVLYFFLIKVFNLLSKKLKPYLIRI